MEENIHYLSAESLEELKKEFLTLKNSTIPDIAKRIDEAKQQGDLSENAEYHQAREDMAAGAACHDHHSGRVHTGAPAPGSIRAVLRALAVGACKVNPDASTRTCSARSPR